jgi:hypothetical protein
LIRIAQGCRFGMKLPMGNRIFSLFKKVLPGKRNEPVRLISELRKIIGNHGFMVQDLS